VDLMLATELRRRTSKLPIETSPLRYVHQGMFNRLP
jgi:hypothetical protein